jgi:hypothetical protein
MLNKNKKTMITLLLTFAMAFSFIALPTTNSHTPPIPDSNV